MNEAIALSVLLQLAQERLWIYWWEKSGHFAVIKNLTWPQVSPGDWILRKNFFTEIIAKHRGRLFVQGRVESSSLEVFERYVDAGVALRDMVKWWT